jgi:hypothetical protein
VCTPPLLLLFYYFKFNEEKKKLEIFNFEFLIIKESIMNIQQQRIESRVETEIANLKAVFEKHKADLFKYAMG